ALFGFADDECIKRAVGVIGHGPDRCSSRGSGSNAADAAYNARGMNVDEIPVAFTPSGGWTGEMPPPVLAGCDTPLADGASDMRCDGTDEHGVNDVAEFDKQTLIVVVATFEDGVHVLRPVGVPIEVQRWIEGEHLIWDDIGFTATLERVT
ncbi:MAG: hypothetical protein ACI8RC_002814, partial [Ilumatobacter sp.]